MYNIYYLGNNDILKEELPFAEQVNSTDEIKSTTSLYWVVDSDVVVTDFSVFDFIPDRHTAKYGHLWKWNDKDYGGVRLLPKKGNEETVMHDKIVCKKQFQILFEQTPGNYFELNPNSTHVWCVDPEYKLADNIDWAPGNFEPDYIHSFHLRGQLEHKYPEKEGGVKLYPREWNDTKVKYHDYLDATIQYPILYVDDVNDYKQRDHLGDDYVWLIDKQHKIQDDIDWAPNPFEYKMIHAFRMPNQLQDKYPMSMGGVRLVPDNWKDSDVKVHRTCPIRDVQYDVFYINELDFNVQTYQELFSECKTEWMWVIDEDLKYVNGDWLYVPTEYEQDYIHVFKLPGHLDYRYPDDCKEAHDTRCGGIRLVRNPMIAKPFRNFTEEYIYKEDVCPVKYDIFYTDDMMDYSKYRNKSKTASYWLVDSEHQINEEFSYVPQQHETTGILIFKFPNDLEHKYPRAVTNISDRRAGGVKLIPASDSQFSKSMEGVPVGGKSYPIIYSDEPVVPAQDSWIIPTAFEDIKNVPWQPNSFERDIKHIFADGLIVWMPAEWNGDTKVHDYSPVRVNYKYEKFASYEEGCKKSKFNWFWVIDNDVTVLEDFDFDFQPDVYDDGKAHVWQKLNPITGKQYDYGGVSLRNKQEKKGRPKYIREPACTQKEFPVYHIQPEQLKDGLNDVYERLATQSNATMMYVVDPYVEVDFDYSYYPTQYDIDVVHVWAHNGSKSTAVRLLPTNLKYLSEEQIVNNTFNKLKEMPTAISSDKLWDRFYFNNNKPLLEQLKEHANTTQHEWFWTIDNDVTCENVPNYTPEPINYNKVHAWQRANPTTGIAHSYGGVRLWPKQLPDITSDDIKLNKMPRGQLQYVKDIASEYNKYEIYVISYKEDINIVDEHIQRITSKGVYATHIRGVKGIFEAHKACAEKCKTSMFWVVDADAVVEEDFDFSYIPDVYDQEVTHVWNSMNPVTGDTYGYGGVKLFNTKQVQQATSWGIDFTTGLSTRFKVMPEVACITRFNTDEYSTWRSAFRECVKLTLNADEESNQRLSKWLNADNGYFVEQAVQGAKAGNEYAKKHVNDVEALNKINDYEWLKDYYEGVID
tara:strand:+ start:205 stop:3471 length:3267 start_codon:yes stop_codon:yes gene_type:complete